MQAATAIPSHCPQTDGDRPTAAVASAVMARQPTGGVRRVSVADAGTQTLFEKLAAETGPLQGERELTVNALEAQARRIVWDYDWQLMAGAGLAKRCIVDDGVGMSGAELERYIGELASSGKQLARTANLGVGAKIACALPNPAGIRYRSWTRPSSGVEAVFGRHHGDWGLRTDQDGEGCERASWALDGQELPSLVAGAGHGTQITLWGRGEREDTFQAPKALVENRSRWLLRYLNRRFFELSDVSLEVRVGARFDADGTPNGELARVRGHRAHLDRRAEASGSLRLRRRDGSPSDARVRWWILDDDTKGRRLEADEWVSSGHVGSLWQGELYTLDEPTRGGYTALQNFGVRHGYERVVLIVEPLGQVESNLARTRLLLGEAEPPWSRWQDEFARQMPEEIRELMRALARRGAKGDLRESVAQRVRQAPPGFFELPRYRRPRTMRASSPGHQRDGAQVVVTADGVREMDGDEAARRAEHNRSLAGRRGARKALPVDHEAVLETLPAFEWLSLRDGTRSIGELEDLALRYDERNHRLQLNRDFRGFGPLFNRFLATYSHVPGAGELIEQTVREEIAYVAFETVQWALALSASSARSRDSRAQMLSPESLTVGLTPRLMVHAKLDKLFRQRHGRPADDPVDEAA